MNDYPHERINVEITNNYMIYIIKIAKIGV